MNGCDMTNDGLGLEESWRWVGSGWCVSQGGENDQMEATFSTGDLVADWLETRLPHEIVKGGGSIEKPESENPVRAKGAADGLQACKGVEGGVSGEAQRAGLIVGVDQDGIKAGGLGAADEFSQIGEEDLGTGVLHRGSGGFGEGTVR